jgi:hypothetical protein
MTSSSRREPQHRIAVPPRDVSPAKRYVNGAHLVALVRVGAKFRKGVLVESELQEGEVAA